MLRIANRVHAFPRPVHDLIHHTYYDRKYLRRANFRVVTVYDMIPELFPHLFPRGNPHRDKREFVEAADLVLCISDATRKDMNEVYGTIQAPVVVTPLGVDPRFHASAGRCEKLPEHYLLFVGDRAGYKDFWVLAEALAATALPREVTLVAVGGGPLRPAESARLQQLGLQRRVVQLPLTDGELAGAYAHALTFVFPSRYEGFGLPTLEAMASGCPTIVTSESSHPEVGGDAVRYFSAGEVGELAILLEQVAGDEALRADLTRRGVARAATFSWAETANRTARAYRDHTPITQ